jgi:hypothetical protein
MKQNHGVTGRNGRENSISSFWALLSQPSLETAADASGISRITAWRWLKDPAVLTRLREARREAMNRAIARLQEAATEAVDCLCQVQRDGESESARVAAARCILEQSLRATELSDVLDRLDAIEQTIKVQKGVTAGPKVSVTYERDEKGNQDGQSHSASFEGTGEGLRKQ